jgi:antitoxin ParD1/3/4
MDSTEELTVSIPKAMMRLIRETVASGEFASPDEALRDAVRVWERHRLENAEVLSAIRARVHRSLEDPRPNLTLAEVDARLDAMFARAEKESGDAPVRG